MPTKNKKTKSTVKTIRDARIDYYMGEFRKLWIASIDMETDLIELDKTDFLKDFFTQSYLAFFKLKGEIVYGVPSITRDIKDEIRNYYGKHNVLSVVAGGGVTKMKVEDALLVKTYQGMRMSDAIMPLIQQLCDYDASITNEMRAIKKTSIIYTDDEEQDSAMDLEYSINNLESPSKVVNSSMNAKMDSFNANVISHLAELREGRKEKINEILTKLGVYNIDYKRERMITSETISKDELLALETQSFLSSLQEITDKVLEKYQKTLILTLHNDAELDKIEEKKDDSDNGDPQEKGDDKDESSNHSEQPQS